MTNEGFASEINRFVGVRNESCQTTEAVSPVWAEIMFSVFS